MQLNLEDSVGSQKALKSAPPHALMEQKAADRKKRQLLNQRNHYHRNREAILEARKLWRRANPEAARAIRERYAESQRESNRRRYWRNPKKAVFFSRRANTRRKKVDPGFAMIGRLRTRLSNAVRRAKSVKVGKTLEFIGCTSKELCIHLESTFVLGMTWDNRHLWHVDHIEPIRKCDMNSLSEVKKFFHYSNLQCLWIEDNLKKGGK